MRHYGDPLGPREQRSVRYVFTPKKELGLGAFKLTFAIHYNDKAKDRFGGPVLTSSVTLVAAPVNPMDSDLVKYGAPAGGGLVVLLLLYSLVGGGKKEERRRERQRRRRRRRAATSGSRTRSPAPRAGSRRVRRRRRRVEA